MNNLEVLIKLREERQQKSLKEIEERRIELLNERIAWYDEKLSHTKSKFLRTLYEGLRNEHINDLLML